MTVVVRLLSDDTGASAAEYVLILAIVGSGLAVAAIFLGNTIGNSMRATANTMATCGDGSC